MPGLEGISTIQPQGRLESIQGGLSPRGKAALDELVNRVQEVAYKYMGEGKKVGILATNMSKSMYNADAVKSMGSRKDLTEIAKNVFRLLREFDEEKVDVVIAEGVPLKGIGLAIMNRLRKAADYQIIKAKNSINT